MPTTQQKDSKLRFAAKLCKEGVISADEFAEAVARQMTLRPQFGSVAVKHGKLTEDDVATICAAQAKAGGKRFGEIAVDLGLLTSEEVDRLLDAQSEGLPDLLEILAEMGTLTRAQIDIALVLYGRHTDATQPIDE